MILRPFLPKKQDKSLCRITCMGVFEGLNSVRYFAFIESFDSFVRICRHFENNAKFARKS